MNKNEKHTNKDTVSVFSLTVSREEALAKTYIYMSDEAAEAAGIRWLSEVWDESDGPKEAPEITTLAGRLNWLCENDPCFYDTALIEEHHVPVPGTPAVLKEIGLFHTPTSTAEIEKYLSNFSGGEAAVAMTVYGMTWNLCAHLTNNA